MTRAADAADAAFLESLVKALADRYGFDLDEAPVVRADYRDAYVVTLYDLPVDEFLQFTIADRGVVAAGLNRAGFARALADQFARARRAVDARVLGPAERVPL